MGHSDVLSALQQFCPADAAHPERGVSLVSRFKRADLGVAGAGTMVFITDMHLVPEGTQREWPVGRVCIHPPERIARLTAALLTVQPAPKVFHLGDLIDIWRTLTPKSSPKARVRAVLGTNAFGRAVRGLRDKLDCHFLVGNHDGRIVEGAPPWLGEVLSEQLQFEGDQMGPYKQCVGLIHGHQFSGIELIPEELKEAGVRLEHKNPAATHDVNPNRAPGAAAYVVEGTGEGTGDDEFLTSELRPGTLVPLDTEDEKFGRNVAFQPQISPIPGVGRNYDVGNAMETFYPMARDRYWAVSTETKRISVLVIGHTHRPRIVYGPRQDGSLFVLMDCGSWRGAKKLSRRMPQPVLNAQIGVIAENDLRIYQLSF
jgi:UDP-2,3-diacylglucosamine pyrophosphatase LpxH